MNKGEGFTVKVLGREGVDALLRGVLERQTLFDGFATRVSLGKRLGDSVGVR